ncbi:unnamed protein product [Microthlaspi erraticum]|uniref:Ribosomal RNA-processing protein 7 C-terminal domain-containing protein n=1 Tax=Microthlaspi erraticum TaxID=1685480 RepID=A0A6D2KU34_9BRAS|nr:unnamed protein product [Microthlaspi erraticum]
MKETRNLKKRNLHDAELVKKSNGEEADRQRVVKKQRKKKEKVSIIDVTELPQATIQGKKVELKKTKMQKSKNEVNSSPVDDEKLQRKRKAKGGNVDLSELPQASPEVTVNEKSKGKKGKLNKTKKKRKAEELSSGLVNDEDDDLNEEVDGDKGSVEAVSADNPKSGTEVRNRKSKKSNKKKKMKMTTTKENEISSEKMSEVEEDVYEISSGDEDCSSGMKKWVSEYYESRPGLDELQKRIDDFMTAHEERLEEEKQMKEAKAAEGGWTVVVHHKGRKKTTESETGTAVGSVSQAANEYKMANMKPSEIVGQGFYRFQRRDAQRNELLALQSKFEQDKKRIQQLRAARNFKP